MSFLFKVSKYLLIPFWRINNFSDYSSSIGTAAGIMELGTELVAQAEQENGNVGGL